MGRVYLVRFSSRVPSSSAATMASVPIKVTAVLRDPELAPGHRYGINSLAGLQGSPTLFSAGRDGTVRCWEPRSVGGRTAAMVGTMEGHDDWVNDVASLRDNWVASCSSDCTIRLWQAPQPSQSGGMGEVAMGETLRQHKDYVKAIAYCADTRQLASAGCDCALLLWDVQRAELTASSGGEGHSDSIYALAANAAGTLIASGSVDTDVRVWDPRSPRDELQLSGHTDIVRSLLLSPDGSRIMSCGSDRTLRVWHIGERRCEAVLTPHDASIFSLAYDAEGGGILSGDSAGTIMLTDLGTHASRLLCQVGAGVQRLHVDTSSQPSLWVATTRSELTSWRLPTLSEAATSPPAAATGEPLVNEASAIIPGAAGVKRFAVLPARQHVLTEDTAGNAALWDVCTGSCSQRFPKPPTAKKGSYDSLLRESQKEWVAVPNWFSVTTKSGLVEITLEADSCFAAEAYVADIGLDAESDARINLGERSCAHLGGGVAGVGRGLVGCGGVGLGRCHAVGRRDG